MGEKSPKNEKKQMKKKYLVVTGGAGFVGSNLIAKLLNNTNYKLISIDNYSTGKKNQISHKRIKYINSHTKILLKFSIAKENK